MECELCKYLANQCNKTWDKLTVLPGRPVLFQSLLFILGVFLTTEIVIMTKRTFVP